MANQHVFIEQMIAKQVALMVDRWKEIGASDACNVAIIERQLPLLALLKSWIVQTHLEPLQAALADGDRIALSTLCTIDKYIGDTCNQLLDLAAKHMKGSNWGELNNNSELAARLAEARMDKASMFLAFFHLANARRGLGDTPGAVRIYEQAIANAQGLPAEYPMLAAAHDNVGNALSELGRFDDALEHYNNAQLYANDPQAIDTILANKANCHLMLGEFNAAGRVLSDRVKQLEKKLVTGTKLAIAMDMNAQKLKSVGELQPALNMLVRAKATFDSGDLRHRAINALLISETFMQAGDETEAGTVFQEAHNLAIQDVRRAIDFEHYMNGFSTALQRCVPRDHEAVQLFEQALYAKEHDNPSGAFAHFQQAAKLAHAAGDLRLFLRIKVNAAALLVDLGQVEEAIKTASEVQTEAAASGLALPEMMALGNLACLSATGANIHDPLGPLGPLTRAMVLREMHVKTVAQFNLNPAELHLETADTGTVENEMAILAKKHGAYQLATDSFRKAIEIARSFNMQFQLVNRLAGLVAVLVKLGDMKSSNAASAEIEELLNYGDVPLLGMIAGHRAIGAHFSDTNRPLAINHLQKAMDAAEQLRAKLPSGPRRAGFNRQFWDVYYRQAELLIREKRDEEAFDVLQQAKGRRLIEALAVTEGLQGHADSPLTAREAHSLLKRAGVGTVLVDLMVRYGALTAFVLVDDQVRTVHVLGDESVLRDAEKGDVQEREARVVSLCLENEMLRELAEGICGMVTPGTPLMIVADQALHNLPLHAVPVQGKPWMEHTPIGYSPTAALLRFQTGAVCPHTGALVAGDSRQDLRGASEECENVAAALGTKALLGPACSRSAIEQALRTGRPDIVHLAVHGRGDPRFGDRSSLLLADDSGDVQWVDFRSLTTFPWATRVVVFSGCSTGLLGHRHGFELLSVANAALEAGAKSVIASLWPVDDIYAKEFMTAFYEAFQHARQSGPVDLRLLLKQARQVTQKSGQNLPQSMRRDGRRHFGWSPGEEPSQVYDPAVTDALQWAPFCLYGAPIFDA